MEVQEKKLMSFIFLKTAKKIKSLSLYYIDLAITIFSITN